MKRLGLMLLFLAAGCTPAWCGDTPLPMQARFLTATAQTGGVARLGLFFRLPPGASLSTPFDITGLEDNQPLEIKKTPDGLEISLIADTLDVFTVGGLSLAFTGADKKPKTFVSAPVSLALTNSLAKEPAKQHARPFKGIVPISTPWLAYCGYAGLAVVLAALVLSAAWLLKKRAAQKSLAMIAPPPSATALQELAGISRAWEKGQVDEKELYFALSAIIRAYMGAIRPFPAQDLTVEEIASHAVWEEDRAVLALLREADLVKFAKKQPLESLIRAHQEQAVVYVKKTSAPVGPKPEEAAGA